MGERLLGVQKVGGSSPLSSNTQLLFSILKISQAYYKHLQQQLKKIKLIHFSELQIKIISLLTLYPDTLTITNIQQELGLSKATISKTLKLMELKKLIKIKKLKDKRKKNVVLTNKSLKLVKIINQTNKLFENYIENKLKNCYPQFLDLIETLYDNKIISLVNMCKNCYFFKVKDNQYYCNLLRKKLSDKELNIFCLDWKKRNTSITY